MEESNGEKMSRLMIQNFFGCVIKRASFFSVSVTKQLVTMLSEIGLKTFSVCTFIRHCLSHGACTIKLFMAVIFEFP
jgi:hypothetical protein